MSEQREAMRLIVIRAEGRIDHLLAELTDRFEAMTDEQRRVWCEDLAEMAKQAQGEEELDVIQMTILGSEMVLANAAKRRFGGEDV